MKTCRFCQTERALDEFRSRKHGDKRYYYNECKPCLNKRLRSSEDSKKYARERQQKERKKYPEKFRGYELKKRHKITLEIYNKQLEKQNNVCAICKTTGVIDRNLAVDHDHLCCDSDKSCGKCLRGLLCNNCNSGLGSFKDDIERLKNAITYLETVVPSEWTPFR
jgi:hypothetical protein